MKETISIKQYAIAKEERLILDRGQSITFYDEFLLILREGKWEVIDEDTSIKSEKNFYNKVVISKTYNFDLEQFFKTDIKMFVLQIEKTYFAFETKKECDVLFEKIINWKYATQV